MDDDLWEAFGAACAANGTSRTDQLRAFMADYVSHLEEVRNSEPRTDDHSKE